jgi:trehalose synthase
MWKGRPVVGAAVGGIHEQIVPDENGLLISDPADLAGFGVAVAGLLHDTARADQLGKAAERRVHEEFLGDTHLERWGRVVADLADNRP